MKRALPWAVAIVGAAGLVGWALTAMAAGTPGGPPAALAGALLAGATGAGAFVWAIRAREVRQRAFIAAVFGSMLFRLILYGAALVAVRQAGFWSLGWFVGGVLGAHFTGQVIEIVGLVRVPPSPPRGGDAGHGERTGDTS